MAIIIIALAVGTLAGIVAFKALGLRSRKHRSNDGNPAPTSRKMREEDRDEVPQSATALDRKRVIPKREWTGGSR